MNLNDLKLKTMKTNMEVSKTISIDAPAVKVWEALTKPELIKKYLFGTEAKSDWKVGSDITFHGEWQGKQYEDKGKIIAIDPNKLLHHTYWSSIGGTPDKPENYVNVKYKLSEKADHTDLTIIQDGVKTEESKKHLEENWGKVSEGIKQVVEDT
jgi:uncharacterized protein YndB with AHSA1/START domain